jgi:hypothetical protein
MKMPTLVYHPSDTQTFRVLEAKLRSLMEEHSPLLSANGGNLEARFCDDVGINLGTGKDGRVDRIIEGANKGVISYTHPRNAGVSRDQTARFHGVG